MKDINQWKHKHIVDELRELRKLENIIEMFGPYTLVNGDITAFTRVGQVVERLKEKGMDLHDTIKALDELEDYYPTKTV
jgi:hypothetical protein